MRFSHEQKLLQPINKPSIEQIRPEIVDKPSVKSPNIDEGEKLKADMLTPSSSSKSIMSYNDDLG